MQVNLFEHARANTAGKTIHDLNHQLPCLPTPNIERETIHRITRMARAAHYCNNLN